MTRWPWLTRMLPARIDPRLWWILGAGVALVAGELMLRAWEQHQQLQNTLSGVRRNIHGLQRSSDAVDWAARTAELRAQYETLQSRLWTAPSEAQAQAMLRDWLGGVLKAAGIQRPTLRLQPVSSPSVATATDRDAGADRPQPQRTPSGRTVRVQAQIGFELAPGALESVLHHVERGGQLASVDRLSVSRRSRRVDMTVSIPVIVRADARPPE